MITKAVQITLFVKDQSKAKNWYVDVLGFQLINDLEFTPGWSYVTVAPHKDSETVIELAQADTDDKQALVGAQAADLPIVMFISDDIEKDYEELSGRGVRFSNLPQEVPGGKGAGFYDLDNNQLDLYQPIIK